MAIKRKPITLTLTPDEAQALRDILYVIGGSPENTRRKHTASIADALDTVGVHCSWWGGRENCSTDLSGTLIFHPTKKKGRSRTPDYTDIHAAFKNRNNSKEI